MFILFIYMFIVIYFKGSLDFIFEINFGKSHTTLNARIINFETYPTEIGGVCIVIGGVALAL